MGGGNFVIFNGWAFLKLTDKDARNQQKCT